MEGPGRCLCGKIHATAGEREACRRRVACHAAGHAVAFCLVFAEACREAGQRPAALDLGSGADAPCAAAVPPGAVAPRDLWKEALVWFGGNAAEDLLLGERLGHESAALEDWRRAERCLREINRYPFARDAFLVTRDILDHNRRALEVVAAALVAGSQLSGDEVWRLVEENPPSDPDRPLP